MNNNVPRHRLAKSLWVCCMLLLGAAVHAQTAQSSAKVTGTILSDKGDLLPNVTVYADERQTHRHFTAVTNEHGMFVFESLTIGSRYDFTYSYVGYETGTTSNFVVKQEGRNTVLVRLKPQNNQLDSMVVVGYGKQKRINLSGAVQSVSGAELANRPISNVNTGLEGLIPNLNISPSNGRATTAPAFNIRGYTSINGGGAFILVDNVPASETEVARLNPSDIENITVLKDAAAAAIYGARAAFGVVLITTKTAKGTGADQLRVSADMNYAVRTVGSTPDIVTDPLLTMQYKHDAAAPLYNLYPDAVRAYAQQRSANPSLPAVIVDPTNPNAWAYYGSTNWMKEAYLSSTPSYSGNINISKKDNKLSYFMSGGYYRQDGLLRFGNDIYNRYNFRVNAGYQLASWFKLGTNTSFTNSDYGSPSFIDGDFFWNVNRTPSLSVPKNPDGSWTQDGATILGALQQGGRKDQKINDLVTSFNAEINLWKDAWTIKGDASFRKTNNTTTTYNLPISYNTSPGQPLKQAYLPSIGSNSFAQNEAEAVNYTVYNVYTDFHKTFNRHYIQLLGGYNQEYRYDNDFSVKRQNLISSSLPNAQLATGTITQANAIDDWAVRGFFYRANYVFSDKYIAELDGRYDGTSRFPANDRWGFFPSASAGWVVSREHFFAPVAQALHMDMFKLRASYGSLGNQNVGSYFYIPSMSSGQIGQILDGAMPTAVYQPGVVSPTLTWEKVRTVNFGTDINMLQHRLDLSYDWYNRYTDGMLTKSKTLPAVFGATEPKTNAADLKTTGWELSLQWKDKFLLARSPFNYGIRVSLADNRTFITRYDNPNKLLSDYYKGERLGEIWGLVNDGFFQNESELKAVDQSAVGSDDQQYKFYVGDLKFKDLNGDHKIDYGNNTVSKPGDRKIIGNNMPRLPYSFELNGDWKGFDLRMFFQGIGKRDWYPNNSNIYFWGVYAQPWTNVTTQNMNHWTPDNPNAYFPRLKSYIAEDATELGAPQTKYLQNAAYLRMKNITLGYSLPASLMRKWKTGRVRFYFSAENVFTIKHLKANMDPEGLDGNIYPFQKTYSMGANINF